MLLDRRRGRLLYASSNSAPAATHRDRSGEPILRKPDGFRLAPAPPARAPRCLPVKRPNPPKSPCCWFDPIRQQTLEPNGVEAYSLSLCQSWSKSLASCSFDAVLWENRRTLTASDLDAA